MPGPNDKYRVRIPDYEYYQQLINCQFHCPVNTDARGYVRAIAEGDYETAYLIARAPNPLASVCGRVCGAPCEAACRRGRIDESVSIRALKRFITEQYGTEAGTGDGKTPLPAPTPETWGDHKPTFGADRCRSSRERCVVQAVERTGKPRKVAIVGAGPAGLAAAHDLVLMGHDVTLFESQAIAGGMLVLGIPEYRLSRTLIQSEIQAILALGVVLKTNHKIGRDFDLQQLRRWGFDAVFLAIGAHQSRSLRIDGVEQDGVLRAIDFLLNVNMGYKVDLGRRVLVIGGGNVAVDVARSALRKIGPSDDLAPDDLKAALQEARAALAQVAQATETQPDEMKLAIDVARSALRLGVKEVLMACLESRREMPADPVEIEDALQEGIKIFPSKGPRRILGENGKVTGVEFLDVASVFDAGGRFNPTFVPHTESVLHAETVILAIGQSSDLSFLTVGDGVELTERGIIKVDPDTLATTAPGVFAGGDVAFGPRLIINAIADGQKAARAIGSYLSGRKWAVERRARMVVSRQGRDHRLYPRCLSTPRIKVPSRPIERRIGIAEVELGFDQVDAVPQAARCLNCSVHPVFDGNLCILCGGCIDVCPENCLKLVPYDRLARSPELETLLQARSKAAPTAVGNHQEPVWCAMLKNEEKCLRCGLCARKCPTGAISMEIFQFDESLQIREVRQSGEA